MLLVTSASLLVARSYYGLIEPPFYISITSPTPTQLSITQLITEHQTLTTKIYKGRTDFTNLESKSSNCCASKSQPQNKALFRYATGKSLCWVLIRDSRKYVIIYINIILMTILSSIHDDL